MMMNRRLLNPVLPLVGLITKRNICRALIIKGLHVDFDETRLKHHFAPFGEVVESQIFEPNKTMKSRIVLLKYKSIDSAVACFDEMHLAV